MTSEKAGGVELAVFYGWETHPHYVFGSCNSHIYDGNIQGLIRGVQGDR